MPSKNSSSPLSSVCVDLLVSGNSPNKIGFSSSLSGSAISLATTSFAGSAVSLVTTSFAGSSSIIS